MIQIRAASSPKQEEKNALQVRDHQDRVFLSKNLGLILLLNGLFAIYLLVKPGTLTQLKLVDNLVQGLLEGIGMLLTLPFWLPKDRRGQRSVHLLLPSFAEMNSPQSWVPLLLGLAVLSYVIGQGGWTYNEDFAHLSVLFPTWADAGYLGSYPFVLLAILLLPRQPVSLLARMRVLLDSLLIMVGAISFSWYFILAPTILEGQDTLVGQIIGTTYPIMTLVLIFCLLRLGVHDHNSQLRPVVVLLSFALITIVITDSIYDYQQLHNVYTTGTLLDVGWPLGYMLVGLGACAMRLYLASKPLSVTSVSAPVSSRSNVENIGAYFRLWQALIPLFFACAAILLLIWIGFVEESNALLEVGVYIGVVILLILIVIRLILIIQETVGHNRLLYKMQQDLWTKNTALQQAYIQLEGQARIEAAYEREKRLNELKDQLIMNVSHELRTPLTQVSGYLELLQSYHGMLASERQEEFIRRATQGCDTLMGLINTILEAAEIDVHMAPQMQQVLLTDVVHEVLEQFQPQLREEHPVSLEIAEGLVVMADPQFLQRVLRNLLSNAFKYTPAQSPIQVLARKCDSVDMTQHPDDASHVRICVQDSGPGIPLGDIPLLFGKFVRLNRDLGGSIRGTGLGLYISKQLVEAMGGSIWVESSGVAGQGSRFSFTLPASL